MPFYRWILIGFFYITLSACASARMAQELEIGKINYGEGKYKTAFHQLLPVAVNGNPQAQYAVGYMYYYGYGVPRDSESGLFWMNKAAAQKYPPAIKALYLINQVQPVCDEYASSAEIAARHPAYKGDDIYIHHDEVLQSLPKLTCHSYADPNMAPNFPSISDSDKVSEKNVGTMPRYSRSIRASTDSLSNFSPSNFSSSASGKYGLQLYGAYQFAQVKRFRQELALDKTSHIWHTKNNGRDWYVLTYGKYGSVMQAKLAEDKLPENMKDLGPWVRKTDRLELVS